MMARAARDGDKREALDLFGDVRKALVYWFRRSIDRRVAFVDGDLAAIWGLDSTFASAVGWVWMMTAPPIEKIPLAFIRTMRRDLCEWSRGGRELRSDVAADYEAAVRTMQLVGFEMGEPRVVGTGVFCDLIYRGE